MTHQESDPPEASKLDAEELAALEPGGTVQSFLLDAAEEESRNMLELTVKIAKASGIDLSSLKPEDIDAALKKAFVACQESLDAHVLAGEPEYEGEPIGLLNSYGT